MDIGDIVAIDVDGLDALITTLADLGYDTRGPVVRGGAIVPGPVSGVADLPAGYHDQQAPGQYRLERGEDGALFGWAVGPGSWKAELFPPTQELWRATVDGDEVTFTAPAAPPAPMAIIGARPCELAALKVLDRVLRECSVPDPRYAARRDGAFVVAADCGAPAATCFCTSMGTGPGAEEGFDLALSEIEDGDRHRYVVRVGSKRGAEVLSGIAATRATAAEIEARGQMVASAAAAIGRRLETEGLPALLLRNLAHPRWANVAERCLSCGNCTLVCPTCFCSDVHDTSDLSGEIRRERKWASCFDLDHSYLHGGPVRPSTSSRYRQWMTHKLATWWDQFDTSGCVGCGRCIAWCPVGIDLTEEAAAIRASDGALRVRKTPERQAS
ncbi:MAG: 4Fe-4S dicluster domain-containing protein [Acidimicrobiales bacterium]|jgi:sulfhydrogenase subunit beta (sulfur reductase)